MVKYCNAACKKKHKKKHKKACDRRVAELHDEALFKPPPLQYEDCPICFLRMPSRIMGRRYKTCCGKTICSGCIHAVVTRDGGIGLCPFCRIPAPTSEEEMFERERKRVEIGDATALLDMGLHYNDGTYGLQQDYTKALELWHRAGELGNATAYHNIACSYKDGDGVEMDTEKAIHYWELAAMRGHTKARQNLGALEGKAGNNARALKHYMIGTRDGDSNSLKTIKLMYEERHVTKDDYSKALRSYQEYLYEVKSAQRDEAAEADDYFKYIE